MPPVVSGRWTTALLALVLFTSGADMLIMTPILPQVAADLGVGVDLGGYWVTAYAAATAIFALVFGPVSDRYGRKLVLTLGMAVLALGTLGCGFAESYVAMLAARFFAGIGAGMLVTSTTSFVGDHFPDEERGVVMGYVMSGFFVSLILAVPLGAALTGWLGWNAMFFAFSGFAAAVTLVIAGLLPHPAREERTRSLSVGSALTAYARLCRDRRVLGVLTMSAAIGMSMTMFSVYSSPWLERTFGLDTQARGLVYAVGGPAVILGPPLAGKLSDRFGRVAVIMVGSVLMALMQLFMPFTEGPSHAIVEALGESSASLPQFGNVPWPAMLPPLLVFFFAMVAGSSRSAPFQILALEVVNPDERGAVAALRNTVNQAGSGLGAAIGGIAWAGAHDGYLMVCGIAAGTTILGVVLLRVLVGMDRPHAARVART